MSNDSTEVPEQVYRDAAQALVDAAHNARRPDSAEWYRRECAEDSATDVGLRAAVEVAYRAGCADEAERIAQGIERYWAASKGWKARFARIARAHGVTPDPPPPIQGLDEAAYYFCEPGPTS